MNKQAFYFIKKLYSYIYDKKFLILLQLPTFKKDIFGFLQLSISSFNFDYTLDLINNVYWTAKGNNRNIINQIILFILTFIVVILVGVLLLSVLDSLKFLIINLGFIPLLFCFIEVLVKSSNVFNNDATKLADWKCLCDFW